MDVPCKCTCFILTAAGVRTRGTPPSQPSSREGGSGTHRAVDARRTFDTTLVHRAQSTLGAYERCAVQTPMRYSQHSGGEATPPPAGPLPRCRTTASHTRNQAASADNASAAAPGTRCALSTAPTNVSRARSASPCGEQAPPPHPHAAAQPTLSSERTRHPSPHTSDDVHHRRGYRGTQHTLGTRHPPQKK